MPKLIEIRKQILKKNDDCAQAMRRRFASAGTLVGGFVSSPGAGKTALLCATIAALKDTLRVATIVGDLETDNDATRLRAAGAPAYQIKTHNMCHLEAFQVQNAVDDAADLFTVESTDVLLIENVGNLVCTASFDLGEDFQAVLVSTTEGEDKPLKYPTIFHRSDLCIITKMDLSDAVGFDRDAMRANIASVRPGMPVFEVSAKTGAGMEAWIDCVRRRAAEKRAG